MAEESLKFDNVLAVLTEYGKQAEVIYKGHLKREKKNASYKLADSVKYFTNVEGTTMSVGLRLEEYWKYIEYGRKPGKFPPPDAILKWIEVKPVLPRPDANGRIPRPQQLAFLIGRKIATQGIEPTPIMAATVEELNDHFVPLITEALRKDIGENMAVILKTKFF